MQHQGPSDSRAMVDSQGEVQGSRNEKEMSQQRSSRDVLFNLAREVAGSRLLNMAHSHSHCSLLLRRLVCNKRRACRRLFAHVALLLLPLSPFLGVRAPSLSLGGFMF